MKTKAACIWGNAPSACRYKEPDASPDTPDEVTETSMVVSWSLPATFLTPVTVAEPQDGMMTTSSLKLLTSGRLRTANWTVVMASLTAEPCAGFGRPAIIGAFAGMYWNLTASEHSEPLHTIIDNAPAPRGP